MKSQTSQCLVLALGMVSTALLAYPALAQENPGASKAPLPLTPTERDGQNDFDWEIGTWHTELSRLKDPLTGSTTWVEYEGSSIVREIWGGRANLVELNVKGPAGQIQGLSLRLYNPETHRWSMYYANSDTGTLYPPMVGSFKDGRGVFYSRETLNGRDILVRFVISDITQNSARFEQAFSADDGETWETNWIAIDTRVTNKSANKRDRSGQST